MIVKYSTGQGILCVRLVWPLELHLIIKLCYISFNLMYYYHFVDFVSVRFFFVKMVEIITKSIAILLWPLTNKQTNISISKIV